MPSSSGLRPTLQEYRDRERRRLLLILSIVATVLVIALIVTLIVVLGGNTPAVDTFQPAPAGTIYVSRSGRDGAHRTLIAAFRAAKPGYRIVVRDGPIEEDATILDSRYGVPKDVTLEVEPGATVEWRLRRNLTQAPSTLLTLSNLDGFTLRGFTFDGDGRVKDLLMLTGACPGLTLADLKLRNFERAGVSIRNCEGKPDRPVTIKNVLLSTAKPAESGFMFDIDPNIRDIPKNRLIQITDVKLEAKTTFTKGLAPLVRPDVNDAPTIKLP
jgi:hypothetical protein